MATHQPRAPGFTTRGKFVLWIGAALICLALVVVKVRVESGLALEAARVAAAKGDLDVAGLLYRRAIRWYTPLSSSVQDALRELGALADQREKAGAAGVALELYRDLRGALYAVRHVLEPYKDIRDQAEEKIAALMAREPTQVVDEKAMTEEARRIKYLGQLRGIRAPDVAWTLTLLFGFFGWVAGAALFFWRGFTPDGVLVARPALLFGAVTIGCFALWVVGMTQA